MTAAPGVRKLDVAAKASINVVDLNNKVVLMRKIVKRANLYVINAITRKVRILRKKKGSEDQKKKNEVRANKLVEEIKVIQLLKPDYVSKYSLGSTDKLQDLVCKPSTTIEMRALARLAANKFLQDVVKDFREKHSDWKELAAYLMTKHTSREFKKKKTKDKMSKVKVNVEATETLVKSYLSSKLGPNEGASSEGKVGEGESKEADVGDESEDEIGNSDDDNSNDDGDDTSKMTTRNKQGTVLGSNNDDDSDDDDDDDDGDNTSQLTIRNKQGTVLDNSDDNGSDLEEEDSVENEMSENSSENEMETDELNIHDGQEQESDNSDESDEEEDEEAVEDDKSTDNEDESEENDSGEEEMSDELESEGEEEEESNSSDVESMNRTSQKGIVKKSDKSLPKNKSKSNSLKVVKDIFGNNNNKRKRTISDTKKNKPVEVEKKSGEMIVKRLKLTQTENNSDSNEVPQFLIGGKKEPVKARKKRKDPFFDSGVDNEEDSDSEPKTSIKQQTRDFEKASKFDHMSDKELGMKALSTTFLGSLSSGKMMECTDPTYRTNAEWKSLREDRFSDRQSYGDSRSGGRGSSRGRGRGDFRGRGRGEFRSSGRGDFRGRGRGDFRGRGREDSRGRGRRDFSGGDKGDFRGRGRGDFRGRGRGDFRGRGRGEIRGGDRGDFRGRGRGDFSGRGRRDFSGGDKEDFRGRGRGDFRGRGRGSFRGGDREDFRGRGRGDFRGRGRGDFRGRGRGSQERGAGSFRGSSGPRSDRGPNQMQSNTGKSNPAEKSGPVHPSWEASQKRKQQAASIHNFTGKKITFDD